MSRCGSLAVPDQRERLFQEFARIDLISFIPVISLRLKESLVNFLLAEV